MMEDIVFHHGFWAWFFMIGGAFTRGGAGAVLLGMGLLLFWQ